MTLRDAGIEAVIFDWGGTLSTWATSVSTKSLWGPAAEALAPHVDQDAAELTALLGAAESDFWERTEHEHPYGGTLAGIVAEAQRRLGADVPPSALDAAAAAYLDAWAPHIEHDAEAAPTLEALRERGLRTAMLSNTHWPRHFHERFLRRDGLDSLLDARLYTCELDYMKPHPSVFGAALAAIGVTDPSRALFVGDRPWDDIFGAQRAGLRTAQRTNPLVPTHDVRPDIEIERPAGAARPPRRRAHCLALSAVRLLPGATFAKRLGGAPAPSPLAGEGGGEGAPRASAASEGRRNFRRQAMTKTGPGPGRRASAAIHGHRASPLVGGRCGARSPPHPNPLPPGERGSEGAERGPRGAYAA